MLSVSQTRTPGKPFPTKDTQQNQGERATAAQMRTALAKPKDTAKARRLGSRSAAVWRAIFAEIELPTEFHCLLLYLAEFAKGQTTFEAYRAEVADGYFAEKRTAGMLQADLKRAGKNREQRFHDLFERFLDWQQSRALALIRYYPGKKIEGESVRGTYHTPVVELFAQIYADSKTTSAFDYVREARIRDTARMVIADAHREWNAPQARSSRTLSAAKRIERARKILLKQLANLTAELNPTKRQEFWGDVGAVAHQFGLTLNKKEEEALDNPPENPEKLYKISDAVVDSKGLLHELGAQVASPPASPKSSVIPLPPAHQFGQPMAEFIEKTSAARERFEAERRHERARLAFENSLSLAEVETCQTRSPKGAGAWKQYATCPDCGTGREKRGRFNVNQRSGGYKCHACGIKGRLREFWENPPSEWESTARPTITRAEIQAKKQAQDEEDAIERAAKIEKARKLYESAAPLAQVPAARDYVQRRTFAADAAKRCGVRYAIHQGRKTVLFPVINEHGEIVAITDRRINSNEEPTRTTGPKALGVFITPCALDAPRVMIVESPLDAIAVYACGFDAIALCGTTWPEWLPDSLESKDVLLAQDNDKSDQQGKRAGDVSATSLANELIGRASIQRLKPSRKDWCEIAELDGLDALRAELAAALFDASTLDDEVEVMQ